MFPLPVSQTYFIDWQKFTENVELAALYKLLQGTKWNGYKMDRVIIIGLWSIIESLG